MQSIIITDVYPESFWQRQFRDVPTNEQRRFDLLFGAFLPLMCFFFDPVVFDGGSLGHYKAMNYLLAALSISGLCFWHLYGERLGAANKFMVGLFSLAAFSSVLLGAILFPISLVGLIVVIGALGFSPFIAAFVYARAAIRACRLARAKCASWSILSSAAGTAAMVMVLVVSANSYLVRRIEFILKANPAIALEEASRLRPVAFLLNFDVLEIESQKIIRSEPERGEALKTAYRILSRKNDRRSVLDY